MSNLKILKVSVSLIIMFMSVDAYPLDKGMLKRRLNEAETASKSSIKTRILPSARTCMSHARDDKATGDKIKLEVERSLNSSEPLTMQEKNNYFSAMKSYESSFKAAQCNNDQQISAGRTGQSNPFKIDNSFGLVTPEDVLEALKILHFQNISLDNAVSVYNEESVQGITSKYDVLEAQANIDKSESESEKSKRKIAKEYLCHAKATGIVLEDPFTKEKAFSALETLGFSGVDGGNVVTFYNNLSSQEIRQQYLLQADPQKPENRSRMKAYSLAKDKLIKAKADRIVLK